MADERAEALRKLGERLGEASQAAERLMAEPGRARDEQRPPPAGWQSPEHDRTAGSLAGEVDALLSAVRSARELVPPEVLHRLTEALKELLLAIRAVIDWYITRLERPAQERPEVEDIPIQ